MRITRDTVAERLGACFEGKMVSDILKTPNLEAALRSEVDPEEFRSQLTSLVFPVRGCGRIAVTPEGSAGTSTETIGYRLIDIISPLEVPRE